MKLQTTLEVQGEKEYKIERILDHRQISEKTQYLVKWKGYNTTENTWEPIQNLNRYEKLRQEYHWQNPERANEKKLIMERNQATG